MTILYQGYDLTLAESIPIILENGSNYRIDKQWLISKSSYIEKLSQYQSYVAVELPHLKEDYLPFLLQLLNGYWTWLLSDKIQSQDLPLIFSSLLSTIDYLDVNLDNVLIDPDLNRLKILSNEERRSMFSSNTKMLRIAIFLSYLVKFPPLKLFQLMEELISPRSFFENWFVEFREIFEVLEGNFLTPDLIPIARVIQNLQSKVRSPPYYSNCYEKPLTILSTEPDEKFLVRLRKFAGSDWQWLESLDLWPKGLVLAGESLATILFDRDLEKCRRSCIATARTHLQFYIALISSDKKRPFDMALNYLNGKSHNYLNKFRSFLNPVRYYIQNNILHLTSGQSRTLQLFLTNKDHPFDIVQNFNASHLQVYFDGRKIYFTPQAYLSWKLKITHITDVSVWDLYKAYSYQLSFYNWSEILERIISQMSIDEDLYNLDEAQQIQFLEKYLADDEFVRCTSKGRIPAISSDFEAIFQNFRYPIFEINRSLEPVYWISLDESSDMGRIKKVVLGTKLGTSKWVQMRTGIVINRVKWIPFQRKIVLELKNIEFIVNDTQVKSIDPSLINSDLIIKVEGFLSKLIYDNLSIIDEESFDITRFLYDYDQQGISWRSFGVPIFYKSLSEIYENRGESYFFDIELILSGFFYRCRTLNLNYVLKKRQILKI